MFENHFILSTQTQSGSQFEFTFIKVCAIILYNPLLVDILLNGTLIPSSQKSFLFVWKQLLIPVYKVRPNSGVINN